MRHFAVEKHTAYSNRIKQEFEDSNILQYMNESQIAADPNRARLSRSSFSFSTESHKLLLSSNANHIHPNNNHINTSATTGIGKN